MTRVSYTASGIETCEVDRPVCERTASAYTDGEGDSDTTNEVQGGFEILVLAIRVYPLTVVVIDIPNEEAKLSKNFHWRCKT